MHEIEKIRKKKNITQSELARLLGVSQANISQWEIGEALPRADKLPLLATILECKIDDLYERNLDFELYDELKDMPKEFAADVLSYVRFKKSQTDIAKILESLTSRILSTENFTFEGVRLSDKDKTTIALAIEIGMEFVRKNRNGIQQKGGKNIA